MGPDMEDMVGSNRAMRTLMSGRARMPTPLPAPSGPAHGPRSPPRHAKGGGEHRHGPTATPCPLPQGPAVHDVPARRSPVPPCCPPARPIPLRLRARHLRCRASFSRGDAIASRHQGRTTPEWAAPTRGMTARSAPPAKCEAVNPIPVRNPFRASTTGTGSGRGAPGRTPGAMAAATADGCAPVARWNRRTAAGCPSRGVAWRSDETRRRRRSIGR
jgi:hypothetical protein